MPPTKKLVLKNDERQFHHEREVETVEQGLKNLAEEAKKGDLPMPLTVTFDATGGSTVTVVIEDADAAQEISRQGFMF